MESDIIEEILKKAGKAVEGLPEHLQGKAFELAVNMLTGASQPTREEPVQRRLAATPRPDPSVTDRELPEVADLLKVCKRNPDRYLVFAQDLEGRNEPGTTAAFVERFRMYRQDTPKLPARDLGDMVAKGQLELTGKGRDATYTLKRKGRERLAQLSAAASAE